MKLPEYIDALPDSYAKKPESNNYKLLQLEQEFVSDLRNDIEEVQKTLDIYTAYGKTLDLYGSIYGQARGSLTDDQYRSAILQKAMLALCDSDANSIIQALAVMFDAPASSFQLSDTETPCVVELSELPYSILNRLGLTVQQIIQMVEALLPAGVRLAPLNLEGTFEFCAVGDEATDGATKGFSDITQTTGGYFGYMETGGAVIPT